MCKTLVVANSTRIIKLSLSTSAMANFKEYSFSAASKIASLTRILVYRAVTSKDIATPSYGQGKCFLNYSQFALRNNLCLT